MSYQPPGPYPVMPMQPVYGAPQRPPIPQAALRSYYAILAGAVLSAAGTVIGLTQVGSIRAQVRAQLQPKGFSQDTLNSFVNIEIGAVVFGGIVGILLWLWMAWKIRTGRHWARVLCSVFFGFQVISALLGGIHYQGPATAGDQSTTATVNEPVAGEIIGWVTVAVGLYALVMFWHKSNAAFFRPPKPFGPAGYPYPYPPQGYPQAPYPQVPGQGPEPVQGGFTPQDTQQPTDPWANPPQ